MDGVELRDNENATAWNRAMTAATSEKVRWTIADLDGLPDNGHRYEIIDGELFVTWALHLEPQDATDAVYANLLNWSLKSSLGKPFIEPGVIFSESDAVIPDVIWISHERQTQFIDAADTSQALRNSRLKCCRKQRKISSAIAKSNPNSTQSRASPNTGFWTGSKKASKSIVARTPNSKKQPPCSAPIA